MVTANADKTLVTIATYNEIENLPRLVEAIFAEVPGVDILVIDDNSPDGTGQWCDERAGTDPRVHCLHRPGKLGLGTATIAGMRYGLEQGYRQVLNMDADFSHHPRYLKALLAGMDPPGGPPVDVMIGSRYIPGGGAQGWPLRRHFMSRAINFYARWLLGLAPHDCSGAYRCYRTSILSRLDFDAVRSRGYSFQEEILWHLKRLGARFGETPIIFEDRRHGSSKIDRQEAFAALRTIFGLGIRNILGLAASPRNRRPHNGRQIIMANARHVILLRVRYSETDQMGTYYNSRVLEWFECGRTELLRAMGRPYRDLEQEGLRLPVSEAHAEYLGKARYDDPLKVTSALSMVSRARIRFDVEVEHAETGSPVCRGYTVHVVTDVSGKPIRPPRWLIEMIESAAD